MQDNFAFLASIAIPTYRRKEMVITALKSVLEQKPSFKFEIIVLDNACDSHLREAVTQISSTSSVTIRYIPVPELGLHNGRNRAALEANGDIIVYIDDDVITPPGWLTEICQPFENSNVVGVGGKVIPQWEITPPSWINSIEDSYFSLLDLGNLSREMTWPETPFGCNMAYRKQLIVELGGFTPDGMGKGFIEWRRGDGETGFAQKVYAQNLKIFYSNSAWLYHCIPKFRLSKSSIRRRATKISISNCYMQVRASNPSRIALIKQSIRHFYNVFSYLWQQILRTHQESHSSLQTEIYLIHHSVAAAYKLRLSVDIWLRRWVFQETYL